MTCQKKLPENQSPIQSLSGECHVLTHLNLYDSPECRCLATQARADRHLRIPSGTIHKGASQAIEVRLCEDDYPGWLRGEDLKQLKAADKPYRAMDLGRPEIKTRLSDAIKFAHDAMAQSNRYLWGGTVGPHYDCSGLVQAAFASVGIWVPRDAYQQEDFTQPIEVAKLESGDLIFFGTDNRATHVGLCIGGARYIHSSGKDHGRDGIGIDQLSSPRGKISQWLYDRVRGAGRVVESYCPQKV